ncbi:VWA domain-containing protein [Streptomyces albidoflavus]|uniref:VWA domain-containing protein n=1 Tax=Streptomyces albidoflavus TaxID=1886 RepID=UPI001F0CC3D3|nr:VWA domain-containing protein [Streptomyces albidoflavus]
MQHLAEEALALAAHPDDDGTVPVVLFDTGAHPATEVSLDSCEGRVQELHERYGHRGTTDCAAAVLEVIEHHTATGAAAPAFVIFPTVGGPDAKREAERVLCRAARFAFLRKLDEPAVPRRRRPSSRPGRRRRGRRGCTERLPVRGGTLAVRGASVTGRQVVS